jgi:ComF family protein
LPDRLFLKCGPCSTNTPYLDQVFTSHRFEEPFRTVLHEFKYHEGLYLTSFLSKLMLPAIPLDYQTDCLIPVPMHALQIRRRGFNQAILLAKHLGHRLNFPVNSNLCQKLIHTPQQAGLNAKARHSNLRHAFQAKKIPYQRVTLIDDLLTTGSTANELARELKRVGVQEVNLWCCAKACF